MSFERGMKLFDENGTLVGVVESFTDTHVVVRLASGQRAASSEFVFEPVAGLVLFSDLKAVVTPQTTAEITAALNGIDGVYYSALAGDSTQEDDPLGPRVH